MSTRNLLSRLERLPGRPGAGDLCFFHGDLCGVGTRPLPEFYLLWAGARQRLGHGAPPLDEHRAMTTAERREHDAELAPLLAEQEAKNARIVAEMEAEAQARQVVDEVARRLPGGPP
jgi:hypothetical protein